MIKRLTLLLLLVCSTANAQFVTGQILTAQQLNNAFANVLALTGGTLSGPLTVPTMTVSGNLTVNGTFTLNGGLAPGSLAPQAANTVLANITGSSAAPTAATLPSCSTANSGLKYTSASGFSCGTSYALTSGTLAQFAATTSAQLAGVVSDETGSGSLVFGTNPTVSGATISGGTISNTPISGSMGSFTTLAASGTVSGSGFTSLLSPYAPLASPTFTGTVTIPGGTINSTSVGATTPGSGSFTTLAASGAVSGTGFTNLFASPPTIGGTAPAAATFTSMTTPSATISGGGISNVTLSGASITSSTISGAAGSFTTLGATGALSGTGFTNYFASPPAIGSTAANTGAFTTLSASGLISPSSTVGIKGTTTNDSAQAGSIGEYASNSTLNTSATTGTTLNATSTASPLAAGDWDVQCSAQFNPAASTVLSVIFVSVNTASATNGSLGAATLLVNSGFVNGQQQIIESPVVRVSLASSATVYCPAYASFTTSTLTISGFVRARRVR